MLAHRSTDPRASLRRICLYSEQHHYRKLPIWRSVSPSAPKARLPRPEDPLTANEFLDLLQWPAMVVTLLAAWLVASKRRRRRQASFWMLILSNALWIAWAWQAHSYALMLLQAALFVMNVRGMRENPE